MPSGQRATSGFTENGQDRIGRIGPDQQVHEFVIPTGFAVSGPTSITLGPDGNLWFVEDNARKISRITPSGIITQFPVPSEVSAPNDITTGPDGKVWFTERTFTRGLPSSGFVANITVNGTINEIEVEPSAFAITRGPDNALWVTTNGLGRMTTNGQYHLFPIDNLMPYDVTAGPDGALWFTYFHPEVVGPAVQAAGISQCQMTTTFPTSGA